MCVCNDNNNNLNMHISLTTIIFIACVGSSKSSLLWYTATLDQNNNTLYVIGNGGITPPGYISPKPLFIIINGSDHHLPNSVVGANGAKSLCLSDGGESLYVATESCIIAVSGHGDRVQRIAGECTETGRRNGPLMYARFMSLTAISTPTTSLSMFIMAIIDSGRVKNNILLANSWSVREIGQVSGAFDLSLVVVENNKIQKEEEVIAVLVLTPTSALLMVGKDDRESYDNINNDDNNLGSTNWRQQYLMLSLNAIEISHSYFTACLLQGNNGGDFSSITTIKNLTYTSYVMDEGGTLWISLMVGVEIQVYKQWKVVPAVIQKLVWGKSWDGRILLKGLNIQGSNFVDIDTNHNYYGAANESNNNNNTEIGVLCTNPWQVNLVCDIGYIIKNQTCIQSPAGGYSVGATYVPCPKGTYNSLPMAVSYLACKTCDAGFIAPLKGSVVCSACNESYAWQSASGDECVAKCQPWDQDTELFKCKTCLPGSTFSSSSKVCQPCPAKTSSALGGQCLQCPDQTLSPQGSTLCYRYCPKTCSIDGLRQCMPWRPPYLVSTIANLQTIPGKFLSMAICSNGTIFSGNDQGVLAVTLIPGGIITTGFRNSGVKTLDIMTLSLDEKYLFIADRGSGMVIKVANLGSSSSEVIIILARNITANSICATVDGLYIIDGLSNSILRLPNIGGLVNAGFPLSPTLFLLLSITSHEANPHSLVVLGTNTTNKHTSICHFIPSFASTSNTLEILSYFNTSSSSSKVMPWISRWEKGKSTICIGHSIVNIEDTLQTADNFNLSNSSNFLNYYLEKKEDVIMIIIAGSEEEAGHQDDEGQASRFISPIFASSMGEALFLMEDQTSTIRTVYARPCECLPNFYMLNETCLPCFQHTYSMSGARGCSTCPSGEYLDQYGYCTVCPVTIWWNDAMYNPCRKMQDTGSSTRLIGLTLFEAQGLEKEEMGLDIVSTATILISYLNEIPPVDILIRGDLLGRLWSISPRLTPKPYDPQGISVQSISGMWALCSPVVNAGEQCNCWHSALRLGYDEVYKGWRESREQATIAGNLNITQNSIFVLRPDDIHTKPPILITGGGSIQLNSHTPPVGDMGLCFVGWPAQFNCTDPKFVWTFPSEQYPGGACLPCPTGTIAETHASVKCMSISEKNPLCYAGTYKTFISQSSSYSCRICPENTYSTKQGAIQCKQKLIMTCLPGFYVSDGGPTSDNTCKLCVSCVIGESVMMPYLSNPCPGNTKIQPYFCVSWMQAIPGFWASVALGNVNNVDDPILLKYNPCNNLPLFAIWDNGPYHDFCYFRCKYSFNEAMIREYAFYFALSSPENEKRWPTVQNLFPYYPTSSPLLLNGSRSNDNNAANSERAMAVICSPCNTSACPIGMWRPLWADGCGPPCLISPNLCQGRSDGCVSICDVSENAAVVGFGTDEKGRATCIWRCNIGWVKIGEVCAACNASLCELGKRYVGNSQCNPTTPLSELCISCPPTASQGGVLNTTISERGKCSYTCVDGYPNPNPQTQEVAACIQCSASVTRCPAGFSVTCALNPCKPCQNPNTLSGRAVLVPTSDSICRVQCKPGFQTINIKDFTVISGSSLGHDPTQILCEECSKWQGLPCPTLSCSPGYQQKQIGLCTPCQTSTEMGCPEGTYAPQCPGGVTQAEWWWCLTCPMHSLLVANGAGDIVPGQWPSRKFIPYSAMSSGITFNSEDGYCPTACVDGSVQIKTKVSIICVACSSLLSTPPTNAPYKKYSSSWNASDGIRWWAPEFDPPHLAQRSWLFIQVEKRAGICWPCPPNPLIGDPCFSTPTTNDNNNNQITQLGEGIIQVDELTFPTQFVWPFQGRRLLQTIQSDDRMPSLACKSGSYPMPPLGSWCSVCPIDHYCIGGLSQPIRCGTFSSSMLGSQSAQNCSCRLGFEVNNMTLECALVNQVFDCPSGFYRSPHSFQGKVPCIPCPRGTYEVNGMCQDCPLQSESAEGSIKCTCLTGKQIIVISEERSSTNYQCEGSSCTIGSSFFNGSNCQTCSVNMAVVMPFPLKSCSCGPGTYYHPLENGCEACPKGTFSQSAGYAACIMCPHNMTTLYTGSLSITSCIFLEMK